MIQRNRRRNIKNRKIKTLRNRLITDPFRTENGTKTITVSDPLHGLSNGASVTFSGSNSIEGIKLKSKPVFSVQYHPESNPGPQDSVYLFEEFIKTMKQNAKKQRY